MAKWRNSFLTLCVTLTLSQVTHAQAPHAADDALSPDEIAQDEPAQLPTFAAPDKTNLECPARIQIIIDKSQSSRASASPRENTKSDDDTSQTMHVYVDCQLTYNWPTSTGRERDEVAVSKRRYFSKTPAGNFKIDWMTPAYHSRLWNAPMPYAMFFLPGIAIHATEPSEYKHLGRRASGGCVRLFEPNAKTLYELVQKFGPQNVLITISDGLKY